jgi:hypothetical protein
MLSLFCENNSLRGSERGLEANFCNFSFCLRTVNAPKDFSSVAILLECVRLSSLACTTWVGKRVNCEKYGEGYCKHVYSLNLMSHHPQQHVQHTASREKF